MPLDHSHIGRRVVIRCLVRGEKGPSGGPLMTDVIGYLREYGDVAVVERRDGSLTRVALGDIVAAKPVPPPPPRRER